jgi:hypothetical protein
MTIFAPLPKFPPVGPAKLTVVDEDESVICSPDARLADPVASESETFQIAPFVAAFGAVPVTEAKATVVGAPEVVTVNEVLTVLAVKSDAVSAPSSAAVSVAAVKFVADIKIV